MVQWVRGRNHDGGCISVRHHVNSPKPGKRRQSRVIIITSPRPKAGKTTTVANLGISLAEIGRRVLLIDGDLRRPRLGKLFGLQFATGLSDALIEGEAG